MKKYREGDEFRFYIGKYVYNSSNMIKDTEEFKKFTELFSLKNGKLCEINILEGNPNSCTRENKLEFEHFMFWLGETQICGEFEKGEWHIWAYKDSNKLEKVVFKGSGPKRDNFIKCNGSVYFNGDKSLELRRIEFKNKKVELNLLCKVNQRVHLIVEKKGKLYFGQGKAVFCFDGQNARELFKMEDKVQDVCVSESNIQAIDCNGTLVETNLEGEDLEVKKRIRQSGKFFFVSEQIVRHDKQAFEAYCLEGKKMKKIDNNSQNGMSIIGRNQEITVLVGGDSLVVWDHFLGIPMHFKTSRVEEFYFPVEY